VKRLFYGLSARVGADADTKLVEEVSINRKRMMDILAVSP